MTTHSHRLHLSGSQTLGWDVYLLILALALIWLGARTRTRGLGYVGGFGVAMFLVSVAAQLTRLESGRGPSSTLAGWPLVLVGLGLVVPLLARRKA